MSKEIRLIECEKCGKVLYRQERGSLMNENGTFATNARVYLISSDNCPDCMKKAGGKA